MPQTPLIAFVETPYFTKICHGLLSDEAYRLAQVALAMNPEMGAMMQGCGGARKVRWGAKGRGKSGGVRTIYYWAAKEETIYLLLIYPKNEKDNLSKAERNEIATLIKEHLK